MNAGLLSPQDPLRRFFSPKRFQTRFSISSPAVGIEAPMQAPEREGSPFALRFLDAARGLRFRAMMDPTGHVEVVRVEQVHVAFDVPRLFFREYSRAAGPGEPRLSSSRSGPGAPWNYPVSVDTQAAGETESSVSRRSGFEPEFRVEAVRLVLVEGRSITSVAKNLDIDLSSLGNWVREGRGGPREGPPGRTDNRGSRRTSPTAAEKWLLKMECETRMSSVAVGRYVDRSEPVGDVPGNIHELGRRDVSR